MENERHIDFVDSRPLSEGKKISRRLCTRHPDRWRFLPAADIWWIGILFFFAAAAPALLGVWVAIFPGLALLLIGAFSWKQLFATPVFDFDKQCFYRDHKKPRYGDASMLKEYLPLSKIAALQLLYKQLRGSKGRIYQGYELNIITDDLNRIHVTDGLNLQKITQDAEKLAERLNVPLKINDRNKVVRKKVPMWLSVLFLVIFSGGGLGTICYSVLLPLWENRQTESWPAAPAEILHSRLLTERRRSKNSTYTVYKPDIRYSYTFKGIVYESELYSVFSKDFSRGAAYTRHAVRSNPPGKKVTCYVNPDRPSQAVISRRVPREEIWFNGILASVFIVMGIGIFAAFRRS